MSAVCPGCGVAVLPGYARCPKCRRPLPSRRASTVAGGTAVDTTGRLPIVPIAIGGAAVLGVILWFALSGGDKPKKVAEQPTATEEPADTATTETPTTNPVPLPEPDRTSPNRVDPNATARDLERALKNSRLWATVEVIGGDVEVRSGSCRDENMIPMVDAARAALRNAGLTRLRCRENNGAVVFEREL